MLASYLLYFIKGHKFQWLQKSLNSEPSACKSSYITKYFSLMALRIKWLLSHARNYNVGVIHHVDVNSTLLHQQHWWVCKSSTAWNPCTTWSFCSASSNKVRFHVIYDKAQSFSFHLQAVANFMHFCGSVTWNKLQNLVQSNKLVYEFRNNTKQIRNFGCGYVFVYSSIHVYIKYIHIYNTVVGTFEPISA